MQLGFIAGGFGLWAVIAADFSSQPHQLVANKLGASVRVNNRRQRRILHTIGFAPICGRLSLCCWCSLGNVFYRPYRLGNCLSTSGM